MKDSPLKVVLISFLIAYVILLILIAATENFSCDKHYRIDYIFPARQISCFLQEEISK